MTKELQQQLFTEFPHLYALAKLPMDQTCMCWGICVGNGWFNIIRELSRKIVVIDPTVQAEQVKEKFGGLRFYTRGGTMETADAVDKAISAAARQADVTCEYCGSMEDVKPTSGWITMMCGKCRKDNGRESQDFYEMSIGETK